MTGTAKNKQRKRYKRYMTGGEKCMAAGFKWLTEARATENLHSFYRRSSSLEGFRRDRSRKMLAPSLIGLSRIPFP